MSDTLQTFGAMNFDSSLSDVLDVAVSPQEYKDRAVSLLHSIVDRRFPNDRAKREVRAHTDRITFSCPYCGDSMQMSWKQRGNIILQGKHKHHFKCFNCGTYKGVNEFFQDFQVDLQLDVINYIAQTQSENTGTSHFAKYDISLLLDVKTIEEYAIDRQEIKNRFNLIEGKGSPAWPWLNKRLQFQEDKFLYSPGKNYLLILNLAPSGKVIGFQKRNFGKFQTKYLTFTLPTIYKMMGIEKVVPDQIDSLSPLYGICSLDFNRPITLFEGPLDSFLFKNSVANTGANKGFPIDLPLRFFYDQDATGKRNSIKKLSEGYSVFLWSKFQAAVGFPYRKKWDWNDILIWAKETNTKLPDITMFFSDNQMDLIDL